MSRSTNPRWDGHPRTTWRGVTPIDPVSGVALLSLETESGDVLRLRIDAEALRSLAEAAVWSLSISGKIGVET